MPFFCPDAKGLGFRLQIIRTVVKGCRYNPAMVRFILILLTLFAVPFLGFHIAALITQRRHSDARVVYPWATLTLAGLILVLIGFVGLSHYDGGTPGMRYVPAHMENGKFIQGRFVEL